MDAIDPHYFPRLQAVAARRLLAEYSGMTPQELAPRAELMSNQCYWYPTAPTSERLEESALVAFQDEIRSIAREHGYPRVFPERDQVFGRFDRAVVQRILRLTPMMPSEAGVESVWSFLSLIVLPDVAFWRFPNRQEKDDYERILGYPRNVFRRLWWRAFTLGDGAQEPGPNVLEDEAVAILERPTIGGNLVLARAIAETHVRRFEKSPRRTEIMRDATKRIRRLHAFMVFHALTDSEVQSIVEEAFDEAARQLLPAGS
jgi:hypothetical protein